MALNSLHAIYGYRWWKRPPIKSAPRLMRSCCSASTTTRLTGKYGLAIMRVIQIAGAVTVLALGSFMVLMLLREREYRLRNINHVANPSSIPRASLHRGGISGQALFLPDCRQRLFRRPDFFIDRLLHRQISAPSRKFAGGADADPYGIGNCLDGHPAVADGRHVYLGRETVFQRLQPARKRDGDLRGRQTMDVEVSTSRRTGGNQ